MELLAVNYSLVQDSQVPANTLVEHGGHDGGRTPNPIAAASVRLALARKPMNRGWWRRTPAKAEKRPRHLVPPPPIYRGCDLNFSLCFRCDQWRCARPSLYAQEERISCHSQPNTREIGGVCWSPHVWELGEDLGHGDHVLVTACAARSADCYGVCAGKTKNRDWHVGPACQPTVAARTPGQEVVGPRR
jgi:hypothetical protein